MQHAGGGRRAVKGEAGSQGAGEYDAAIVTGLVDRCSGLGLE